MRHLMLLALCAALSACATAPTADPGATLPAVQSSTSTPMQCEPEPKSALEQYATPDETWPGVQDFAIKQRERGEQAIYDAFRNYLAEQCSFAGCQFRMPTLEQLQFKAALQVGGAQ